jgi:hypothetical protein
MRAWFVTSDRGALHQHIASPYGAAISFAGIFIYRTRRIGIKMQQLRERQSSVTDGGGWVLKR